MQMHQYQVSTEDHAVAKWAALAIALHVLEAIVPSPLPGVKPGIANIVVLLVLCQYGLRAAIWVSILRVFASSLLLGQFLSPTFVLSLTGALCSLLVLSVSVHLPKRYFSVVSLSVLAAFGHVIGQLCVVRLWLIPHNGIGYLIPIFMTAALFFGVMNGMLVAYLQECFAKNTAEIKYIHNEVKKMRRIKETKCNSE